MVGCIVGKGLFAIGVTQEISIFIHRYLFDMIIIQTL